MPAPRKQSPSSPTTDRQPRLPPARAEALRWLRAGYQAGHQAAGHEQVAARWHHLVASYRARHAADQQAKADALLLDIIDALASLFTSHDYGET